MTREDLLQKTLPELKQMCRAKNIFFSPDDGKEELATLLAGAATTATIGHPTGFGGAPVNQVDDTKVSVSSGASSVNVNVANLTVGQIRDKLMSALNIDPEAAAILNGDVVNSNTIVRAGDSLEYIKRAGKKGQETDENSTTVEETTMELNLATPTVAVIDGKTMLCNLEGNVAKNTFIVGDAMGVTQAEFFDWIEMSLMGKLFTITVSQLAQISTRNLSDHEEQDWNIAKATYARADALKDKYLLVSTVQRIR